ncbi:uncharacterized protein [Macrobrachium rosenbergii]|uniref:uncharacterized protein n=1 Tax=Macrobrachium rosenbergii TaxID=79674 RepID=UPI0034D396DE
MVTAGISTISGILQKVCAVIWARLKTVHMPEMSKERWEEVTKGFEKYANFPNCIGAIDGKHIRLVQPRGSGSLYYNYKSFFSTVLLAVCDANYSFTYVNIGAYGKSGDSAIFTHSLLYKKLVENTLDVPDPKPISTDDTRCLPYVIVGDESFGIMEKGYATIQWKAPIIQEENI